MLLYQFDAAVSRVFSWSVFKKGRGSGFRVQGSGFRVQGSGFRVVVAASLQYIWAMPEGKWIAGLPFGISNH